MRNNKIYFWLVFLLTVIASAQNNKISLLLESGINDVNSSMKLNFGTGVEYSFSPKQSLTFRVKYLQSGIDYHEKSSGGFFSSPSGKLFYEGKMLKFPINYKYRNEFFFKRINYFFSLGIALNFTLQENFIDVINFTPKNNKTNLNLNASLGVIYKLNDKIDVYVCPEIYLFDNGKTKEFIGFFQLNRLQPNENLIVLGVSVKL